MWDKKDYERRRPKGYYLSERKRETQGLPDKFCSLCSHCTYKCGYCKELDEKWKKQEGFWTSQEWPSLG